MAWHRSTLAAAVLAALLLLPERAPAQSGAPTPLRLDTPQQSGEAGERSGALPEGRLAAVLQSRIAALEEQVRQLTGRVEEAEYREQQTRERIDRLVADLDRRLAILEQQTETAADRADAGTSADDAGIPEAMTAEGAAPADSPGDSGETAGAGDAGAAPDADSAAREGYVLGTIPRDAVLGVPEPGQGTVEGTAPRAALEGSATARFAAALELLQTGDFAAAEVAFARWLADYPEHERAPVAAYWIGEAQLAREAYADAAASFAGNYRTYGADAPRAADSLLKLGTALAAMGDTSRACQTFTEMARRYPDVSSALDQALERERRAAGCG